jgi:hypothetical protein
MSTGKIDRQPGVAQLKRTEQVPAPVVPAKVEEVKSKEPENLFGARSKALDPVTGPDGKAVSKSASTNALWGQTVISSAKPPLSALTLKNLTPEQAKAKMGELQEKAADLEQRMDGRAKELDAKWDTTLNRKRCEILKGYMGDSSGMSSGTRTELEGALKKSDDAQQHQDALFSQAKALGPKGAPDHGTVEERHALAVKLMAARHATTAAVQAATATVDNAGLKIERLALTEAKIDPSAGANSKYGSMLALAGSYFETRFMMDTLNRIYFSPTAALVQELDREAKESAKRRVIEDAWRERDDLMRDMLKELSFKELSGKRDVGQKAARAERAGNVGAMSVSDAEKLRKKS